MQSNLDYRNKKESLNEKLTVSLNSLDMKTHDFKNLEDLFIRA